MSMKKWPEAVCLLERALEHVTQSLEQYKALQHDVGATVHVDKEKVRWCWEGGLGGMVGLDFPGT